MKINILNEELRNQIAAGEVIENPASVIKELVENSLDANAKNITIHIENYGLKKIVVEDDGIGIPKEELKKATLRHATSKIKDLNDLYSIKTFGFRGEALASIFSVSKAKIYSKIKESEVGYEYDGKEIIEKNFKNGTKVKVEDLFYNTPARRKYLRKEIIEYKEMLKIIEIFSLINYNVNFKVFHNKKLVFNKPSLNNLKENLIYLLKIPKNKLVKVNFKDIFSIEGYISSYDYVFNNKKKQYIYVNGRYIKSKLIEKAIYDAYGTKLMGKNPFFMINIMIDPEIIDVNIHPKKIEVKFENEILVYNKVYNAILDVLKKNEKVIEIKDLNKYSENLKGENLDLQNSIEKKDKKIFNENFNSNNKFNDIKSNFTKTIQKELSDKFSNLDLEYNYKNHFKKENSLNSKVEEYNYSDKNLDFYDDCKTNRKKGPLYNKLKEYRILGQINKTFILIEIPNELLILDQHIIEEKKFFEELKSNKNFIKKEKLLVPKEILLNHFEILNFKLFEGFLKNIGYKLKLEKNTLYIYEIPKFFNQTLDISIIKEILTEELEVKDIENYFYNTFASKACKKSIKSGKELTNYEIKKLIEDLRYIQEPYNCPHGRPILMSISFSELEKYFKRII